VVTDKVGLFPVWYWMYQTSQGGWLLGNVIVFGVNVGLAFRDRFALQYRKNKGDLDLVIEGWTVDIEIEQPEKNSPAATVVQATSKEGA